MTAAAMPCPKCKRDPSPAPLYVRAIGWGACDLMCGPCWDAFDALHAGISERILAMGWRVKEQPEFDVVAAAWAAGGGG